MMPLMVDPQLGGYFNEQELIELATIARDCVRDDPGARPSMRDVVQCMETRLRVDASLFENIDPGEDVTDAYAAGVITVPILSNPPHVRHTSGAGTGAPIWQTLETFAISVKNALISPRTARPAGAQGDSEDFEMSSLLVMSGVGTSDSGSGNNSGRLPR